jgi:hypothetical protein
MEKISWTDRVKNKEVLQTIKVERNNLNTIKQKKANWIGHISYRNRLLKRVIEGKIEGTGRRERRHKQLLDDHMETRRY